MRRVWEELLSRPFLPPVFRISHLHCGLIFLRFFFVYFPHLDSGIFFSSLPGPAKTPPPAAQRNSVQFANKY